MGEITTTPTPPSPSRQLHTLLGMSSSKSRSFKELCNSYKSFHKRCQSSTSSSAIDETNPPPETPETNVDASKVYNIINIQAANEQNDVAEKPPNQLLAPIVQSPPPAGGSNKKGTDQGGFFLRPLVLLKKLSRRSNSTACSPTTGNNNINVVSSSETPCSSSAMRRSVAPMVFTQSRSLNYLPTKKAPPIEMALDCTLEELFRGRIKRVKITRHVVDANGIFMPEEETLKIKLMPGWKAGTKITFEGKGDDRLGFLPPDVVFVVNEKPHHLFSRDGDNLVHEMEVSLTDALAGCTLSVPLIGRENMWLSFADGEVISPGYQKVIRGQGMPVPGEKGRKGDFLIRFSVSFPAGLSDERRSEACRILRDCCYS